MKKILLGSTALLGLGLMGSEALAQVELTLSGNARFEGGWVDEDEDAGAERDYDFRQDGVIQFNFDGVADNGLEYGGELELDDVATDEGVEVDEAYVYIGGGFGQVRLGDKEGASTNFAVTAPTTGSGGFDGNYGQYMLGNAGSYLLDLDDQDADNTRISYFTPEFGGFQGGIGYATSNDSGKAGPDHREVAAGRVGDIFDIGANYSLDVSGFNVLVGGGYKTGSGDPGTDDLTGYHVGANVGFGGFTIGAAYVAMTDTPEVGVEEEDTIQLGATYEFGAWTVGANAALDNREFDDGSDADTDIYAVGGNYAVAPGLAVYADLMFVDAEANPIDGPDNEATVFVVGTSVAF